MLNFRSAVLGFWMVGLLLAGCQSQRGAGLAGGKNPDSSAPGLSSPAPVQNPSSLAQKTSRYARQVSPLLEDQSQTSGAATQSSIVKWSQPDNVPAAPASATPDVAAVHSDAASPPPAAANVGFHSPPQPKKPDAAKEIAMTAGAKLKQDSDVPQILPETVDELPTAAPTVNSDDLEKRMLQAVRDYPRDLAGQLDYQMLRFVRDEPTPDLSTINQLSSEDREILASLLDGMNNFRNTARADGNMLLSRKIQPLIEMADRLRSQAELTIPAFALCTEVHSYGVYAVMPSPRFVAGKANNEVVVYCEVGNFTSNLSDDKMWKTQLKQDLTLYSESGLAVWPDKSTVALIMDKAHVRRHDFFVARKVTLPATLSVGRYLLKVTMTDEQSNRVAEATTPVEIVAP